MALGNCPTWCLLLGPSDVIREESKATNCKRVEHQACIMFQYIWVITSIDETFDNVRKKETCEKLP